jgi:putative transposase
MDPLNLLAQGKIKRYFRATKKVNTPGIISHITQRAAGKEPLFLENSDYLVMLKIFKEIALNYALEVYCFCLMPNHVHFIISPKEPNLYGAMRDLFSRYAMHFNRKYERKGHLFGGPYRQAVCYDDRYLLAASLYIHLNPAQASIVKDPIKYRWSSLGLYSIENPPKSFVNPDFILELLSGEKSGRIESYEKLLKQGIEIKTGHILEREDAIERFGSKLAAIFPVLFKKFEQTKKIAKFSDIDLLGFETLERKIEEIKAVSSAKSPEHRKAKKYLMEQLVARGFTKTEIAEKLGISRKTVYNILKKSL